MKKLLTWLLLTISMICLACGTVYAAEVGSVDGYLLFKDETKVYTEPNSKSEEIDTFGLGDSLVYTGEMFVDDNGRSWLKACRFVDDSEFYWVPSKNVEIVDVYAVLESYPNYHDGFVFEIMNLHSDSDAGRTDEGYYPDWIIEMYEVEYDNLSNYFVINQAPELVYCSWTDEIIVQDNYVELLEQWNMVKDKKTLVEYGLYYSSVSCLSVRTYESLLFVPDEKEIAGPQTLVYVTEDKIVRIDFVLEYEGGYSDKGWGWNASDVKYSIVNRVKTND